MSFAEPSRGITLRGLPFLPSIWSPGGFVIYFKIVILQKDIESDRLIIWGEEIRVIGRFAKLKANYNSDTIHSELWHTKFIYRILLSLRLKTENLMNSKF